MTVGGAMRSRQRHVFSFTLTLFFGFSIVGGGLGRPDASRLSAQQPELPPADQQRALGQVAVGQAAAGDSLSAARTLAVIDDPAVRDGAVEQIQQGAGGGAIADFATLMALIESTVEPDTWDTLGGPSSMFPYPGGIYVDSQGLLHETVRDAAGDRVQTLREMLDRAAEPLGDRNTDWKRPARLRCVSLRRLSAEIVRQRTIGNETLASLPDAMRHMAGLSDIKFVMLDPDAGDIVLAGPFGGIDRSDGWTRDRASGQVVMMLSAFTAAVHATQHRQPFGCSIDPTDQAIADALAVADKIQRKAIPLSDSADAMREALGRQRVRIFGTSGDQPLAWLLVEADRHMKQLALGEQPMPDGVPSYLDAIDRHIAAGVPDQQLLRLWFTGAPMSVRAGPERLTFALSGTPLKLARENQIPDRFGGREHARADIRLSEFVESFNRNLPAIVDRYPLYSALISVYRAAALAELLHRHADVETTEQALGPLIDSSQQERAGFPVPREVESIAVMHTVQHKRQRHHILIASGGVWVEPQTTLARSVEIYPPLGNARPAKTDPPREIEHWWWDREG